jgi:hypothetical protein
LSYKHPVKRVAVNARQLTDPDRMLHGDGQRLESAFDDGVAEVVELYFNSPQAGLDGNLPDRRRADENLMVDAGNRSARVLPQLAVIRQPPEQDVSIEK